MARRDNNVTGRGSDGVVTMASSNDDESVANGRNNVDQRWAALRTERIGCMEARHRQTEVRRVASDFVSSRRWCEGRNERRLVEKRKGEEALLPI
jgi:hypothetical protein